ncbi:MAG TPA: NlpC/P60 family protein [Epsilonproteobacteria bacterium]|nr:NlpC/P60 family protein [Campylobacterota bacterium]
MRYAYSFLITVFLTWGISGCTKAYHYPNYDIIEPSKTCKPNRKNIQKLLNQYLNKPYIWAEEGPNAFDCSGLTYNIYGQMGVRIPRVARDQAKVGKKISYDNLIYGDLIFFGSTNPNSKRINHVGIYLGNGWFAQASSQDRKVTYTNFADEPVYLKRMKICRRYMSKDEKRFYMTCHGKLPAMKTTSTWRTTPWKPGMKIPRRAVPR